MCQLVLQLVLQLGRIDMAQARAVVWCWSAADLIHYLSASMQHPYSTNVVLSNMANHFGPDFACC